MWALKQKVGRLDTPNYTLFSKSIKSVTQLFSQIILMVLLLDKITLENYFLKIYS